MSYYGQLQPAPLPPECYQQAANLARWFPEVLLTLGAPGLEETVVPSRVQVSDDAGGRTVEVVLERFPSPGIATAATGRERDITATLAGLSSLTNDYEALAANAARPARHSLCLPRSAGADPGFISRLDSAADGILALSHQLADLNAASPGRVLARPGGMEVPTYVPSAASLASGRGGSEAAGVRHLAQQPPQLLPRHASCPLFGASSAESSMCREYATQYAAMQEYAMSSMCPGDSGTVSQDNTPTISPGSGTRGGHQGRQGHAAARPARHAGRSRTPEWRSQRKLSEEMTISINKVERLSEEPASPKFHRMTKVWGSSKKKESGEDTDSSSPSRGSSKEDPGQPQVSRSKTMPEIPHGMPRGSGETLAQASPQLQGCDDRSAAAIKQRIDAKLSLMFGSAAVDRTLSAGS